MLSASAWLHPVCAYLGLAGSGARLLIRVCQGRQALPVPHGQLLLLPTRNCKRGGDLAINAHPSLEAIRQRTLKWSIAVRSVVLVPQATSHPPRKRRPCWSVKRAQPSAEGQTRHATRSELGFMWFHVVSCERMLAVRSRCAGRVVHLHARARSPDACETAPRGDAYLGCLS